MAFNLLVYMAHTVYYPAIENMYQDEFHFKSSSSRGSGTSTIYSLRLNKFVFHLIALNSMDTSVPDTHHFVQFSHHQQDFGLLFWVGVCERYT